jgi:beta-glucanase (GH16 family)
VTQTLGWGFVYSIALCAGLNAATPAFDPAHPWQSGYGLTFHDEFDGPSINPNLWRTAYPWGPNTTINGELQYYPDIQNPSNPVSVNPFSINHGTLTISATPHAYGKLSYVSGVITTYKRFRQTYGYFEAEMKAPSGAGAWPAFWLLPDNNIWPPELDIMEMTGSNPTSLMTTEHDTVGGRNVPHACYTTVPDMSNSFHIYGLLWTKTDLTWYFDNKPVCHLSTAASLRVPMYMLLNLAIGGGGWAGTPQADMAWPQRLQIQYIRAYTQRGTRTTHAESSAH